MSALPPKADLFSVEINVSGPPQARRTLMTVVYASMRLH